MPVTTSKRLLSSRVPYHINRPRFVWLTIASPAEAKTMYFGLNAKALHGPPDFSSFSDEMGVIVGIAGSMCGIRGTGLGILASPGGGVRSHMQIRPSHDPERA